MGQKKIYYISYFGDSDKRNHRASAPAADAKIEYIAQTMIAEGYEVEVISFREFDKRDVLLERQSEYIKEIGKLKIHYFESFSSKYKVLRLLGRIFTKMKGKRYILSIIKENDAQIIIYHSLALVWLAELLRKKRKRYIYEVEEIYADVMENEVLREKEVKILRQADAYVFPTTLLSAEINKDKRPEVIIHGTYHIEPDIKNNILNNDTLIQTIHCVYAGTLDPRKGGAIAAINAARYLPINYHVHVLGFGTEKEIKNTLIEIAHIAETSDAKITYDGVLSGAEYVAFLQSCQIGLSTQNPSGAYNATSFPSKILSYMANGLKVVSIRIPAVETSAIGDSVFYYEHQEPNEIAEAIIEAGRCDMMNPRSVIDSLNREFKKNMKQLIELEEYHGKMEG